MRYDACAGLLGALNCGVILLDANERIVLWNAWMAERSGIAEAEAVGRTLAGLFPHLAGTRIEQSVRMALRSGLPTILSHNLHPRPFPLFTAQPGGSVRRGAPKLGCGAPGWERRRAARRYGQSPGAALAPAGAP